jgi:hypothetical protein
MSEPRLKLLFAHRLISGMALRTMSATRDKRNSDSVTDFPTLHMRADSRHDSREFMTRHVRQNDVGVMPRSIRANRSCRLPMP